LLELSALALRDAERLAIARLNDLSKRIRTRDKCVSGLQSLKRAYHKLFTQLDKRERWDYWYEELTELNTLAVQLNTLQKSLK